MAYRPSLHVASLLWLVRERPPGLRVASTPVRSHAGSVDRGHHAGVAGGGVREGLVEVLLIIPLLWLEEENQVFYYCNHSNPSTT